MSSSTDRGKAAIEAARQARLTKDRAEATRQAKLAEQARVAAIVRAGLDLKH